MAWSRLAPLALVGAALAVAAGSRGTNSPDRRESDASASAALGMFSPGFEANVGQWSEDLRFVSRGTSSLAVGISDDAMVFRVAGGSPVSMRLVGGRPSRPFGERELPGKVNYLIGNDPTGWHTNVPTYARVLAHEWRPGVDLVWYGGDHGLEFDLIVAAGTDASLLAFDVEGADRLGIDASGALEIATPYGVIVETAPRVLQNGRELTTRYRLDDDHRVSFEIEGYDRTREVLIDPVVLFQRSFGGDDWAFPVHHALGRDAAGNLYIGGNVERIGVSATSNALQSTKGTAPVGFVAKLTPSGNLLYSTYFGGTASAKITGLATDPAGFVHVTGWTTSADFPLVNSPEGLPSASPVRETVFAASLAPNGSSLVYSRVLRSVEQGLGLVAGLLAVDASGNAYVARNAYPTCPDEAWCPLYLGPVLITKLSPTGDTLYSHLLDDGWAEAITTDSAGATYVGGHGFLSKVAADGASTTYTRTFPGSVTAIAVDPNGYAHVVGGVGGGCARVAKVTPDGSGLTYSACFGGPLGGASASDLTLDSVGNAYITGMTETIDLPVVDASQPTKGPGLDAFFSVIDPSGQTLRASTYFGGVPDERGTGVVVGADGNPWVFGEARERVHGIGANLSTFLVHYSLAAPPVVTPTEAGNPGDAPTATDAGLATDAGAVDDARDPSDSGRSPPGTMTSAVGSSEPTMKAPAPSSRVDTLPSPGPGGADGCTTSGPGSKPGPPSMTNMLLGLLALARARARSSRSRDLVD